MKRSLNSPLTAQEVERFIDAKVPADRRSCPRCGVDRWNLSQGESGNEMLGLSILDERQKQVALYPAIVFSCENCGFVSMHAKQTVLNWLEEEDT
ncbi:hypothetical protein ACP4J4_00145 [Aureimonas ureilytica]|uniref:hypothetical protein n=1 Tax=Aureimonas ureilytica TaxID=401562 RepID=UPI003CF36245